MKLFTTAQAAKYLGMSVSNLRHHVRKGHMTPDVNAQHFLFSEATLEAFRREHLSQELTIEQAAQYLGVSVHRLRNHIYHHGTLEASAAHGNTFTYSKAELDRQRAAITARQPRGRPRGWRKIRPQAELITE